MGKIHNSHQKYNCSEDWLGQNGPEQLNDHIEWDNWFGFL